jgi:serine/threonine-protein kinase RsbW
VIEIQNSESIPYTHQLRVPSRLTALVDVLSWFAELAHPFIPQSVWLRCQLALAEGFTNAVRHAHKNLPSEDLFIEMKVRVSQTQIILWIWDYGPPFDLMQKLEQISDKTVNKNAGGGRGLKLIQDIADELSYEPTEDGRNCLKIVKDWQPRTT